MASMQFYYKLGSEDKFAPYKIKTGFRCMTIKLRCFGAFHIKKETYFRCTTTKWRKSQLGFPCITQQSEVGSDRQCSKIDIRMKSLPSGFGSFRSSSNLRAGYRKGLSRNSLARPYLFIMQHKRFCHHRTSTGLGQWLCGRPLIALNHPSWASFRNNQVFGLSFIRCSYTLERQCAALSFCLFFFFCPFILGRFFTPCHDCERGERRLVQWL